MGWAEECRARWPGMRWNRSAAICYPMARLISHGHAAILVTHFDFTMRTAIPEKIQKIIDDSNAGGMCR